MNSNEPPGKALSCHKIYVILDVGETESNSDNGRKRSRQAAKKRTRENQPNNVELPSETKNRHHFLDLHSPQTI